MAQYELPADFLDQFRALQQVVAALGTRVNPLIGRPHAFQAAGTGAITVHTSADTKYGYANELADSDGDYDVGNTRYVAPMAGWYLFAASLSLPAPGPAGTRWVLSLAVNGGITRGLTLDWTAATWSNDYTLRGSSGLILLAAGDVVTVLVTQNSGADQSAGTASVITTVFTGGLLGPA